MNGFLECDQDSDLSIPGQIIWENCLKKLREILQEMGAEHREMHSGVSKCGKEIDKVRELFYF